MSFDLIIPHVKPLEPFILNPNVSEVMVNADGCVFIEENGLVSPVSGLQIEERKRAAAVRIIARLLHNDIDEQRPLLDARLPDGSRVAAVMAPVSVGGTVLSIRKFRSALFSADELVRKEMLSSSLLEKIKALIAGRKTILISGGTGSGKTTLLNALSRFIPMGERIVLIEDTAELSLQHSNLVRLEARREQDDAKAIPMRDLLKQTLRLRPDRIIVGEVRGAEAFDLLQALNTGHEGSLTTIHANSARLAVERFRTLLAMAGSGLPDRALARNITEVVQVLIHIERKHGQRRVAEVLELGKYDSQADRYEFTEVS